MVNHDGTEERTGEIIYVLQPLGSDDPPLVEETFPVDHTTDARFVRIDDIARGSLAHVEEVEEKATGHRFARKRIVIDRPRKRETYLAIFTNEVKTMRRLTGHVHFVRLHVAYATDRSFSLILEPKASDGDLAMFLDEYLQGDLTDTKKALMTSTLEQAFGCLASGLAFMHGHSIRHKDIKPGNILLHNGMVYYTDFGGATDSSSLEHSATSGAIDGGITKKYAAFEVILLGERDSKTDIFSLACVFMEIYYAIAYDDVVPEGAELYVFKMDRLLQHLAKTDETTQERKSHLKLIALLINEMVLTTKDQRPDARTVCYRIFAHEHHGLCCSTCREHFPRYDKYFRTRAESVKAGFFTNGLHKSDAPAAEYSSIFSTERGNLGLDHAASRDSVLPLVGGGLSKGQDSTAAAHSPLSNTIHESVSPQLVISKGVPDIKSPDDWLNIEEGQHFLLEDVQRLPYKHEKLLGYGSSAYVEQVYDRNTGQVYAKKTCIFSDMQSRHDKEEFFNNEISITRLLKRHHHIVRLYATYVAPTEMGLMLQPAADGDNLERYVSTYRAYLETVWPSDDLRLTMSRALEQSFGCLANGLAYIHSKGIQHRDIKPKNILMHKHSVVIIDFGSSRNTTLVGKDTTEGNVDFQTRKYSAPEVLSSSERGFEADVYSLGCVFIDIFSALYVAIQYDRTAHYAQIMVKVHDSIDHAAVVPRSAFLKNIIKSMTRQSRSERRGINMVYRQISQQTGFCCVHCEPSLSYPDWKWDETQSLHYSYDLDQHGNEIGHQWNASPPTTVMYRETSSSTEATANEKKGIHDAKSLLLPGQPSSSDVHSVLASEMPKYLRVQPSSYPDFYTLGRVFKMIWTGSTKSGASSSGKSIASSHHSIERNEAGESREVRRFVVVANKGVYSQCIAIQNYRRGSTLNNYGLIYTSLQAPKLHSEEEINKHEIRVDAVEGQLLREGARLNYNKHISVEHSVKVVEIGMVVEEHRYLLTSYFNEAINSTAGGSAFLKATALSPYLKSV